MWKHKINIDFPYDYKAVLHRFEFDPMFTIDNNTLKFGLYLDELTPVNVTFSDKITIESNGDKDTVINKVIHILQLDKDLNEVNEHFKGTNIEELFELYKGMPLCLDTELNVSLFRAIIHQQVSMKGAFTLTRRLIEKYGKVIDGVYFFPSINTLANLKVEDLREIKFNIKRSEYIIDTAKMIDNGDLNLYELGKLTYDEIYNKLIKIRGIGRWTINCLLLFGFGKQDLFLTGDLGLVKGIQKYFKLDERPDINYLNSINENWSPYSSYATFYFWRYVGDENV